MNGKKKFKRILVEDEKFKLRKLPSKDFIALFSSRRRVCPVLKHNRVSEVFKGSKVHDFEYYGEINYVLKWKFDFFFDFKKLLGNALRFVTDS